MKRYPSVIGVTCALLITTVAGAVEPTVVSELKITTLSTMLTELRGVGEWGFAALIEADGKTLLFDTGARPDTVLKNAEELGIDLSTVDTVVLSHNHWDHTGGLVTLRRTLKSENASAMQRAHVADGIFLPRIIDPEALGSLPPMPKQFLVKVFDVRDGYEALGGRITVQKLLGVFQRSLTNCIGECGSLGRSHGYIRRGTGLRSYEFNRTIQQWKIPSRKIKRWSSTPRRDWSWSPAVVTLAS